MDPKNALDAPGRVSSLNIKGSEWETVAARLSDFTKLESLRIERAAFDQFPAMIYDLSGLRNLLLLDGRIGEFPVGISRMERLCWIKLSRMAIPALPLELGKLPALQLVQLEGIRLHAFSVEEGDYAALEQLELTNCELSTLPDELGRLPRLRALTVSGNPLKQIPPTLATAKKLESLYADGCRLSRFPGEVFSLPALERIDLTGNAFPRDEYEAHERLAKSHPQIEVLMPRSSARKSVPGAVVSEAPLAPSIQQELDRLGAKEAQSDERRREMKIVDTAWPVPAALGELLSRIRSPRKIVAPFDDLDDADDDLCTFELAYGSGALDEHECIHHHPYVAIAMTDTYFHVVVRLDDKNSADPILYVIDSENYKAHEARELWRLSAWLKKARPADDD